MMSTLADGATCDSAGPRLAVAGGDQNAPVSQQGHTMVRQRWDDGDAGGQCPRVPAGGGWKVWAHSWQRKSYPEKMSYTCRHSAQA